MVPRHNNATVTSLLLAIAFAGCTESKQTAGAKSPKKEPTPLPTYDPPSTDGGDDDGGDDLTPDCDADKDFNQLDFPDEIKDCLRDEKVYDFNAETCTTMWTYTSECSYATVRKDLKTLGIDTSNLDAAEERGLKLIGCGASNDGYTIVTQAWEPTPNKKADCSYAKQGTVVQSCFRKVPGGTAPPMPDGDEAIKDYVSSCMKAQ